MSTPSTDRGATAAEMETLLRANAEGFARLIDGKGTAAERRADLLELMVGAWGAGYAKGLRRGGGLVAGAIHDRLSR